MITKSCIEWYLIWKWDLFSFLFFLSSFFKIIFEDSSTQNREAGLQMAIIQTNIRMQFWRFSVGILPYREHCGSHRGAPSYFLCLFQNNYNLKRNLPGVKFRCLVQIKRLEKHNVFSIPVLRINSDPQTRNQRNTFKRTAQFTNVLAKTTISSTSICSGSWNQLILGGMGPQHRLIFKSPHRGDSNP